ncbi:DNA primase [Haloferula sp.]|uniref:DNA primase n=1 Tax=Haloferula sp. TaxID=2497595 RepID=UPI00329AAD20
MPQIPRETVEQVLAATDIVELIGSYLPVKRAGARYVCNCPFHNEKTPSFSIDPARQFFHCFGCKKSGDALTFVRDYEGLTFVDAVKKLAGKCGVAIVEEAVDPREERARRDRGRLLDLQREASRFFHQLLLKSPDAAHARDYLKSRGFGKEMAERWEVGWAPDSPKTFLDWAREKGLRGRDLCNSGLAIQRETGGLYLRFRDRLMFPVRNDHGDVIAFSGRQLREDPRSGKYINSPETALFKKSNVLFGLDKARKGILDAKAVLICEGQIDAICCQEQGIANAIATLGTACTPQHAKTLKRYTKQALLCFDADGAGFRAAEKAYRECATVGISVRVVRMPAGEDPDSFMKEHGADAFRELLDKASNFFDFMIERATEENRLNGPQERAEFSRDIAPLLSVISDAVTRDAMINHVATRLRGGVPELRDAVSRAARGSNTQRRFERRRPDDEPEPPAPIEPSGLDPTVGYLCSLSLHSFEARQWLSEQFETLHEMAGQLDGIPLLQKILTNRAESDSPAAVNSFMAGLEEADRMALHTDPTFSQALPENPLEATNQALAEASALALEREDASIKAALAEPGIAIEDQIKWLQRAKEIADLLGSLTNRAITTDRFAPNAPRRKPDKSWKNRRSTEERNP